MSSDPTWGASCPVPVPEVERVSLGHGSGGRLTGELIERMILPAFTNPVLDPLEDHAVLPSQDGRIAFTTDSYVVTPIFFPGGDIGELAINGTINDLVVGGARPLALSLALILEEGLPLPDLQRVLDSARCAAADVGVPVVTGDTKVVGRGSGDQVFINTSGIGVIPAGRELGSRRVRAGDAILVSGTIGDHGVAILSQREGLGLEGQVTSDTAPLWGLVETLLEVCPHVHAMRDPTRGGVAATLVEIATRRRLEIEIDERTLPIRDAVRGACELLGLDPLMSANEGKLVVFVPEEHVEAALQALRSHPLGRDAARIGAVMAEGAGTVLMTTAVGGRSIVDLPYAEPLPRIC
jgi:hydrogenase expression/formation protein HypE